MTDLARTLLLTTHLLASALAAAGPLLVAGFRVSRRMRTEGDDALRRVTLWSVSAMAIGLIVGLLSLGLVWHLPTTGYQAAAVRFPAGAYQMLAAEWCFTAFLYGLYLATWRQLAKRPLLHGFIALVAATNLLYHFPTIMIVLGALAEDPALAAEEEIARPVVLRLMLSPALLAKATHYWALCLLVSATAIVVAAARSSAANLVRAGAIAGLAGTVAIVFSGVAALLQIDTSTQRALIGGDLLATTALGIAVASALGIGNTLLSLAIDATNPTGVRRVVGLLVLAVAAMAWASHRL